VDLQTITRKVPLAELPVGEQFLGWSRQTLLKSRLSERTRWVGSRLDNARAIKASAAGSPGALPEQPRCVCPSPDARAARRKVERRFSPRRLDRRHFVHPSFSASCIVQKAQTGLAQTVNEKTIHSPMVDRLAAKDSGVDKGAAARHMIPLLPGG
jgi:hypothetical protein